VLRGSRVIQKAHMFLDLNNLFLSDELVKFLTLADMEWKRSSLSPLNFGHLVRK
jgi:hypothetical protein